MIRFAAVQRVEFSDPVITESDEAFLPGALTRHRSGGTAPAGHGGLVTSTVLTLLVIPSLYLWFAINPEEETVEK